MAVARSGALRRILAGLPLAILSPLLLLLAAMGLAFTDLVARLLPRRKPDRDTRPDVASAAIVIPNWNGRDLLEKYLPSVVAAAERVPGSEVIVVDNGSTDGSAAFVRERFPQVRVVALEKNLGFGGGSNAGFRAARHDVVVLLNSDMRVEPDLLQPLLDGFTDEKVFRSPARSSFPIRIRFAKKPASRSLGGSVGASESATVSSPPFASCTRALTAEAAPAPLTGGNSGVRGLR